MKLSDATYLGQNSPVRKLFSWLENGLLHTISYREEAVSENYVVRKGREYPLSEN